MRWQYAINKDIFETKIQRLPNSLIFIEKVLGVHVQRMLEMSALVEILSKTYRKKRKQMGGPYIRSYMTKNDLVPMCY